MSKSEILKKMLAVGLSVMSCVPAVGATGSDNEDQSKIQAKEKSNIKKVLVAGAVGTGVVITAGVALHKLLSSKNTEKQNNQEIKSEKSNIQNQNSGKPEQVEVNTTNQDKKEPKPEKKVTPSQDKKKPEVKKKVTPSQDKKEPEVKKKVTPSQDKKEPKPEKKDTPDQDWEKSKIMVQAGALACEAYSVKSIRDYIKGFPKGDAFMDAMKYMFEVFEGRERLDSINVKKNLSIISYYIKEKSGELKRIFKKIGSDNRLILSFNENSEVSVAEKIKDLTGPEICLLLKVGKGDLHIDPVSRFFRPGDIILEVNNFDKITNTKDEKYELNMVFNCIKGTVFVAVKNESGKWILFLNNKIEEVSQEYVMKLASCTDGEMHLGYVRK